MRKLLLLLVLLSVPTLAQATTYYVRTGGSNTHTCSQAQTDGDATAKATVLGGAGCLAAGDTLVIHTGTYSGEQIVDPFQGGSSWATATTIKAAPGETVTIVPAAYIGNDYGVYLSQAKSQYIIFDHLIFDGINTYFSTFKVTQCASHIRIQYSEMLRTAPAPNGGDHFEFSPGTCASGNGSYNEVIYNKIHDSYSHGVYISGAHNTLVAYNEIYNGTGYGVHLYNGGTTNCDNNIVHHNLIHNNGGARGDYGIGFMNGHNNLAYDNILYGNRAGVVLKYGSYTSQIYNNTIYNNTGTGDPSASIEIEDATNAAVYNNIVFGNSPNAIFNSGTATTLGTNPTTDPSFINATSKDFNLAVGSGAIDAGSTVSGNPHVCVGTCDVGALEVPSAVPTRTTQNATTIRLSWTEGVAPLVCGSGSVSANFAARQNAVSLSPTACTPAGSNAIDLTVSTMTSGGGAIDVSCSTRGCVQDSALIGNKTDTTGNATARSFTQQTVTNTLAASAATLTQTASQFETLGGGVDSPDVILGSTLTSGGNACYRLRLAVKATVNDMVAAKVWSLYRSLNGGAYAILPSACVANDVCFYDGLPNGSLQVSSLAATGQTSLSSGSFVAGALLRAPASGVPSLRLLTNQSTEFDFAICGSAVAQTVDFRLRADGNALDTYTVTPRFTNGNYAAMQR